MLQRLWRVSINATYGATLIGIGTSNILSNLLYLILLASCHSFQTANGQLNLEYDTG